MLFAYTVRNIYVYIIYIHTYVGIWRYMYVYIIWTSGVAWNVEILYEWGFRPGCQLDMGDQPKGKWCLIHFHLFHLFPTSSMNIHDVCHMCHCISVFPPRPKTCPIPIPDTPLQAAQALPPPPQWRCSAPLALAEAGAPMGQDRSYLTPSTKRPVFWVSKFEVHNFDPQAYTETRLIKSYVLS